LERWYINITTTILDIIDRPVFYLKHGVSETGLCHRFQAEPTQLDPKEKATEDSDELFSCGPLASFDAKGAVTREVGSLKEKSYTRKSKAIFLTSI
jgi:hypothetical protein